MSRNRLIGRLFYSFLPFLSKEKLHTLFFQTRTCENGIPIIAIMTFKTKLINL